MKRKRWKKYFQKCTAFAVAVVILLTGSGFASFAEEETQTVLYRVTFEKIVNGSAVVNGKDSAMLAAGAKATVKTAPDKGYEVSSVVVKGKDGEEILSRSSVSDGKVTFNMPAQDCIVHVEFAKEKTVPEKETAGDATTDYIAGNIKKSKVKEAEDMSEEYWEKEAPADAAEAGRMYRADAEDKTYSSKTAGASNVKDSVELDDLEAAAAEKYYDENGLRQTSHDVTVTYTIANDRYLKVSTIKELFAENVEAFLTAVASTSPVYESKDIDDAYIAFLNYGALNGLSSKILDAEFVTGEQHGPVDAEKDIVFDKTKGIVYIPKSYYFSTDGTEIGYDLQAQLLVCPKGENLTSDIQVSVDNSSKAQAVMDKKSVEFSAFDTLTIPLVTPETAKKIAFKDIHVYLNDSAEEAPLTEGDLAVYDQETGEYTINQLASNIYSVKFAVNGKSLTERILNFFRGTEVKAAVLNDGETAGAKMNAVKNVTTGRYITPSIEYDKLSVKDTFAFDGKNRTHKFELIKDMMDAGVKDFVYGPYLPDSGTDSIRDAFYFAIADDEGSASKSLAGMIDKLDDKGSKGLVNAGEQNPDAGASSTVNTDHSRYYWYMFLIGAPSGTLTEVDSGKEVSFGTSSEWKWSDTYSYEDETTYRNMYPAMCCHIGNDILDTKKKNQVSVLEKKDGYVVLGLVQSDEGSSIDAQAGATIIKVYAGGKLRLKKVSANSEITKGNPCYSLAGAQYGIYASQSDAEEDKDRIATLTTKTETSENGEDVCYTEETENLSAGTYYVKELVASKGYELDSQIYAVNVEAAKTVDFTVMEEPLNDPNVLELFKIDKDTGEEVAQGAASLAGAQFTIKYYAGYYTKENLPNIPTRTWVFETKEVKDSNDQVRYILSCNNNYKVLGDDLYDIDGTPTFPLGTISVEETKAPEGYLLDDAFFQVGESTEKIEGKYVSQIHQKGDVAYLTGGNVYSVLEQVKRGDFEFTKIEAGTHKRLADIPFSITSKTTGESHTIITDENGYVSTSAEWNPHTQNTNRGESAEDGVWFGLNADGGNVKIDDTLGALPYDTYLVEELSCEANKGKQLIPPFEVTISRDDYTVNLGTLTNDDKTKVLISKTDAVTGEQVTGATLELYRKNEEEWEKVAETVTTDKEWTFTAETGDYKLVETMAPDGYLVAEEVTFSVANGEIVRRVEMKDEPIEISGNIDKKQTIADGKDTYEYTLDYCSTSNTWADELNVTDPLESVNAGYTRLLSIQTPVSFDDYDGKMNVWYQTNKTNPEDTADANTYNACSTNPENPANPDNERMMDYTGWKLWKEGISTLEAEHLYVPDLKLGEDEYVTAFRFEHGRVAEGFTTRKGNRKSGELDTEKNERDNLDKVMTPHEAVFNLKDAENQELQSEKEIHYAPAVVEMKIISGDYKTGEAELVNSAQLTVFRNKGVTDKLRDEDEDRVVQRYEPEENAKKTEESSSPSGSDGSSKTSNIIKSVQTGLSHYGGWFALAAAVLAATAVLWRHRSRIKKKAVKSENEK